MKGSTKKRIVIALFGVATVLLLIFAVLLASHIKTVCFTQIHYVEPPCLIGGARFQPAYAVRFLNGEWMSAEQYSLPKEPDKSCIDKFLGAYINADGNSVNVYSIKNCPTDEILFGERGKMQYYLLRIDF